MLAHKTGEYVEEGELLATLYSSSLKRMYEGELILREAYRWGDEAPVRTPHFLARVSAEGIERLA